MSKTDIPQSSGSNPARLSRRAFGIGAGALIAGGAVFASRWYNIGAEIGGDGAISVQDAHQAALSGDVLLIDIRRPDEWQRTGVGEGAIPLDMRREDFAEALLEMTNGTTNVPVALICARGVRSRGLAARLSAAGFEEIIDVPEGMLGSGAGPGWLKSGLPVTSWTPA